MSEGLEELKKLFPSGKEMEIAGKKILVKPMVWSDFLVVIDNFGKIMDEISKNNPNFDLTKFDEKRDLGKLVPVMKEIINIFATWLKVDFSWLSGNLTLKGTMILLGDFLEVNEWRDVKSLFLALKLKVQGKEKS